MRNVLTILVLLLLTGCGGSDQSIEAFEEQFREAVQVEPPTGLYELLDLRSQTWIRRQLETLRGLEPAAQQQVAGQLGLGLASAEPVTLHQITPAMYLALMWRNAVRSPVAAVEARRAGESGLLLVKLENGKAQEYELVREAGRWAWRLPPAQFETARPAAAATPPAEPEPNPEPAPDPE